MHVFYSYCLDNLSFKDIFWVILKMDAYFARDGENKGERREMSGVNLFIYVVFVVIFMMYLSVVCRVRTWWPGCCVGVVLVLCLSCFLVLMMELS